MKAEIKNHLGTLRIFVDGEILPEISLPEGKRIESVFVSDAKNIKHPLFVSDLYEFI